VIERFRPSGLSWPLATTWATRGGGAALQSARRVRDKAKVGQGVLIIERLLPGRLCNRIFFSLAEGNAAVAELLKRLNRIDSSGLSA
jgi:hypothetical protein